MEPMCECTVVAKWMVANKVHTYIRITDVHTLPSQQHLNLEIPFTIFPCKRLDFKQMLFSLFQLNDICLLER